MSAFNLTPSDDNSPTFSFQRAVFSDSIMSYAGFGGGSDLTRSATLYSVGCDAGRNCTAMCQDPAMIFANPYTLHNCIVLASLVSAMLYANGSLPLQNSTFSKNSVDTANNFSIDLTDPNFPQLGENVHKIISECLHQYCTLGDNCYSDIQEYYPNSTSNASYHCNNPKAYCYPNICFKKHASNYNPDICGIGVCD